jgi:hypothetical protein
LEELEMHKVGQLVSVQKRINYLEKKGGEYREKTGQLKTKLEQLKTEYLYLKEIYEYGTVMNGKVRLCEF